MVINVDYLWSVSAYEMSEELMLFMLELLGLSICPSEKMILLIISTISFLESSLWALFTTINYFPDDSVDEVDAKPLIWNITNKRDFKKRALHLREYLGLEWYQFVREFTSVK